MPAPLLQQHSLTWGVLQLAGPPTEDLFDIDAVDGWNLGNPTPIIEALPGLLVDGALAMVTGWENREVPIRLRVSANDGEALGEAEAALFQQVQLDQPPPLVWTSPVGLSATSVFDVVVAKLERDTSEVWDTEEFLRGCRYYLLTLTCLPFARSVESTIAEALPVPAGPEDRTVVDDCTATTGWSMHTTGSGGTGPTVVDGSSIQATATLSANKWLSLTRTGSLVVPTDYYVAVDVETTGAESELLANTSATPSESGVYPVATTPYGESGSTRLFFPIAAGTHSAFQLVHRNTSGASEAATLTIYNVSTTDTLGVAEDYTTARQATRQVTVLGSAPTKASLRLYDATPADLGTDILVYTSENTDFHPSLRRWIDESVSAGPVAHPELISGWSTTAVSGTPLVYLIPAEHLHTGTYALLANIRGSSASVPTTLTWQARMVTSGGATTVGSEVVATGEVELTNEDYEVVDLAAMVLPVVEIEGTNYALELTLSTDEVFLVDEAWLFNLDEGVLTWIRDGEGMDWADIRSPDLGAARPSVWGGRNALGTNGSCIDWKCLSFGAHRFNPGTMQVFTAVSTSLVSQCEIEYFPRYFGNVWGEETA